ncbi:MAG: peptidylprolyl isomerase, partial [Betaproteobacteria bacterium]
NVVDNQMLDYRGPAASEVGYCVFGRVIKGLEVVSKIRDLPTTNRPPNQNVPLQTVVIERAVLLADKTANKKPAPTAKP